MIYLFAIKISTLLFSQNLILNEILNYTTLLLLIPIYLAQFKLKAKISLIIISVLFSLTVITILLHSTYLGNNLTVISNLSRGLLVSIPFFFVSSFLTSVQVMKIFYVVAIILLCKFLLNFIIIGLFFVDFIDFNIIQIYFGELKHTFRITEDGVTKMLEKGLIFSPLFLLIRGKIKLIAILILFLSTYMAKTTSYYTSFILYIMCELIRYLPRKYIPTLFLISTVTLISTIGAAFYLKPYSFNLKLTQFTDLSNDFKFFGAGLGVQNLNLFQIGDIFVENSFINLVLWLGVFGLILSCIFIFMFVREAGKLFFQKYDLDNTVKSSLICSILLNSASNPYLFSSSVLVALFLANR